MGKLPNEPGTVPLEQGSGRHDRCRRAVPPDRHRPGAGRLALDRGTDDRHLVRRHPRADAARPDLPPGRADGTSPSTARSSSTARRSITRRHRRGRSRARSATRTPASRSRASRSGAIASPATSISGRDHVRTTTGADGRFRLVGMPAEPGTVITANPGPAQPYLGASAEVPAGSASGAGHGRLRTEARRRDPG